MEEPMKIHTKHYLVREGEAVDLKQRPTTVDPVYGSKSRYEDILANHVEKLSSLQQLHYASSRHAVLLIFQAMDAAGKDGAIRHVMSGVNPQGCQVFSFKHPSATELEHDFLWRTTRDLPERGRIGIFNRSYYEEVLVVRVHREILLGEDIPDPPGHDKKLWHDRYRSIVVLPPPLEGGAAAAFPGADRPARQELEDQPGRHRGAEVLEALQDGLRAVPGRDQHG
jgi:polyphosphate kinase 2 (PPK2 family)